MAQIAAIAAAHGVPDGPLVPIESIGNINSVYLLGDRFVLRVSRHHPGHVAQARREALAIPAAVDAGVSTPQLVSYDDSLEGYREVRPAEPVTTEASILWRRLQLVLSLLPRGAAPGWAWAERPVARPLLTTCSSTSTI